MYAQRYYTQRVTCRSFLSEFEAAVQADSHSSLSELNSVEGGMARSDWVYVRVLVGGGCRGERWWGCACRERWRSG